MTVRSDKASISVLCTGRGTVSGSHCCYLAGVECVFLVDSGKPGIARFRCGLRAELGSWDAVHADPRYQPIGESFKRSGTALCGPWQPKAGECCREAR